MSTDEEKPETDLSSSNAELSFFLDGLAEPTPTIAPEDLPLPEDTDRFRFIREVGRGGMGVVYEVEDLGALRHVALKLVPPRLAISHEARERFAREAQSAAQIQHEHCVFVYGAHEVSGIPAIAMELMTGESLADRLESGGAVEPMTAINWIRDVLDGIAAAHELDLVHRDIKPSNLFLDATGRVKVGDFGLARLKTTDLELTKSGVFLGSPLYASPEQVRGRELDHRSDIYSVGATLYALISGAAPFETTSIGDLFAKIATESPPPLREHAPSLPLGLDDIIAKAMAKEPKNRFQSALEMRHALAAFHPDGRSAASLGLRFVALALDYFIITLLALLILWAVGLLNMTASLDESTFEFIGRFAILILYFGLFEHFWGTTPAKRLAGLRVVSNDGGRPPLLRALLRSLTFFICAEAISQLPKFTWQTGAELAAGFIPLVSMRQRNGYRGLHELVSGTRTVTVRSRFTKLLATERVFRPRRTRPYDGPKIEGYSFVAAIGATKAGEVILARETRLQRFVWLVPREAIVDNKRSSDHLRWLGHTENHEVFEDPGGLAPSELERLREVLDWSRIRDLLLQLGQVFEDDDLTSERIWVSRRGRICRLPFAFLAFENEDSSDPSHFARAARQLTASTLRVESQHLPHGASRLIEDVGSGQLRAPEDIVNALLELGDPGHPPSRILRAVVSTVGFLAFFITSVAIGLIVIRYLLRSGIDIPFAGPIDPDTPDPGIVFMACNVAYWLLLAAFLSATAWMRRSPLMLLFGIRLVDGRGQRVSRWLALARGILVALPVVAIWIFMIFGTETQNFSIWSAFGMMGAMTVVFVSFVISIIRPDKSLADIITRTHLSVIDEH